MPVFGRKGKQMLISKWILVVLLGLQVHFAASYLVPLDERSRAEFGGLLGWFWPWAYGDSGVLGQITLSGGFPIAGFYLAILTGALFLAAALAVAGWWVPLAWWRPLATLGAVLLLCLMLVFFGPTKLIPIGFALGTVYIATSGRTLIAVS
jgi:hypothetical protein